jgi:hypothetical protein
MTHSYFCFAQAISAALPFNPNSYGGGGNGCSGGGGSGDGGSSSGAGCIRYSQAEAMAAVVIQTAWREHRRSPFNKDFTPVHADLWGFAAMLFEVVVGSSLFSHSSGAYRLQFLW